jgi:hypothetical protein
MNKMKKILIYLNLLIVTLLLASCKDFLDVNTDPNNPTKVTPQLVLPTAQNYTAQLMQNNRRINNLGNMLMYNWSQSDGFAWYPDEFKYLVTSSFYQGIFNDSYTASLKQYNILDNQSSAKYVYFKAIGKIMKAYHFQLLVDMYGDVPYTEALGRSLNATPKYDDAQGIYDDLIIQLTDAIALIDNAVEPVDNPGTSDIMFGGNMTTWKKFANTLKLRILIRESDVADPTYIQDEIDAIVAEGSGYITTDVGVNPGYRNEANKQNPIWSVFGFDVTGAATMNNQATCATDYVLQYLADRNDPRIDFIYEKPSTGHLGVPQGLLDYDTPVKDAFVPALVSNIGPGILKAYSQSAIIFTLAESYFNQAEASVKTYITDDAKTLYEQGIAASFSYLGASGASTYYNQGIDLVGWGASANKLEAIITQKWLAVNGITAEQSWFDYSRTGYPSDLPISLQATTADRPVRLFYTAGELSANGANVPTQPNAFTGKIFWGNVTKK